MPRDRKIQLLGKSLLPPEQLLRVAAEAGYSKVIIIGANEGQFANVDILCSSDVTTGEAVTMCEHAKLRAMGYYPDET